MKSSCAVRRSGTFCVTELLVGGYDGSDNSTLAEFIRECVINHVNFCPVLIATKKKKENQTPREERKQSNGLSGTVGQWSVFHCSGSCQSGTAITR